MAPESSVKALLVAVVDEPEAAIASINKLSPDLLLFFVPDTSKAMVETVIQPHVTRMPKRWDWILAEHPHGLAPCMQVLAHKLPDLLQTWEVRAGELTIDMTGATPAMAGALAAIGFDYASRVVSLAVPVGESDQGERIIVAERARLWRQANPWEEMAVPARREAAAHFNRGAYRTAATDFSRLESKVSGGQKPLYHALGDVADGYALWDGFHYRQAWERLKGALKALELATVWGGPPGLKGLLPVIKRHVAFLEQMVLDPQEIKLPLVYDLLAHGKRRVELDHHVDVGMIAIRRALEALSQYHLFARYRLKAWDVNPDQLPQTLQEHCRACYLDDLDGKYKLPFYVQYRALADLGHPLGQAFLAQWAAMKTLLDAAGHGVLGYGFEPVKAERFHQLHQIAIKLAEATEGDLPRFPVLSL